MPKPTIVDFVTIGTASIMQPLFDLAWDVFGSDTEDSPVTTVDEAREKLKAVAQAGDTMTGPLTLPASDPTLSNHATRKAYVDSQIEAALDAFYPVGSIYLSLSAQDANGFLPGTWVKLAEGTFLVAAGVGEYPLNATGGAAQVTLTEAQMPSHVHYPLNGEAFVTNRYGAGWAENPVSGYLEMLGGGTTAATGGSQPHENRPPYLAVNMWQRTA